MDHREVDGEDYRPERTMQQQQQQQLLEQGRVSFDRGRRRRRRVLL
jgi:hypothetical protein